MNVRLLIFGADAAPFAQGDIQEVREVPTGQSVKTDTASQVESNLTMLNVPANDAQLAVARNNLLAELRGDPDPDTGEPVLINIRRYTIDWTALNQGLRNNLESDAPGQRRGSQQAWPAVSDLQLIDRSTLLNVSLVDLFFPPAP